MFKNKDQQNKLRSRQPDSLEFGFARKPIIMPETLVIEWGRDRLLAAIGSCGSSSVQIQSAVSIDRQGGELLPSELGEKLAAGLKSAGISAS